MGVSSCQHQPRGLGPRPAPGGQGRFGRSPPRRAHGTEIEPADDGQADGELDQQVRRQPGPIHGALREKKLLMALMRGLDSFIEL